MAKRLSGLFAKGEINKRLDGWRNLLTGLGTWRDKTTHGTFELDNLLTLEQLQALYHGDDTAKRICAFRPQEMLRQGIMLTVDGNPDFGQQVTERLTAFDALRCVRDAMTWGRCYGGGALIIGADDGLKVNEPLNEAGIQTIKYVHVVSRRWIQPSLVASDVLSDNLTRDVQTYLVTPSMGGGPIQVHRSRMLLFGGAHTDDEIRWSNGGWDLSVLQAPYNVLRDFNSVWQAGAVLMHEASQAVWTISGLLDILASGGSQQLHDRMTLADMSRSVVRAIMIDADKGEKFERQAATFTDAQQMLDRYMLRMAAAAEMPVTLLMGRSPAGENATGDSDFRYFYDTIRTAQQNDLLPQLRQLVRLFLLAKDSPTNGIEPEGWQLKFPSLWQLTQKEQAELEKLHAEKDSIYLMAEVLQPEEVALGRFQADGFNTALTIDRAAIETTLQPIDEDDPELKPDYVKPEDTAAVRTVSLAPTDAAWIWTVNEAREAQGGTPLRLPDGQPDPDGNLPVGAYRAKCEASLQVVGEATGKVEAQAVKGAAELPPDPVPPPMVPQQPPKVPGLPPVPDGTPPKPDEPQG